MLSQPPCALVSSSWRKFSRAPLVRPVTLLVRPVTLGFSRPAALAALCADPGPPPASRRWFGNERDHRAEALCTPTSFLPNTLVLLLCVLHIRWSPESGCAHSGQPWDVVATCPRAEPHPASRAVSRLRVTTVGSRPTRAPVELRTGRGGTFPAHRFIRRSPVRLVRCWRPGSWARRPGAAWNLSHVRGPEAELRVRMRLTVPHAPYVMTLRVELGPQPTLLTVTEYLDLFLINSRSRA